MARRQLLRSAGHGHLRGGVGQLRLRPRMRMLRAAEGGGRLLTGWAWTALALYAVWLVTAFGERTVMQLRRAGDTGFPGLSSAPGSASWWASVLFVVALLGAPAAALAGLFALAEDAPVLYATGTTVAVLNILGTLGAMGASWRVGRKPAGA
ncbi:hypothetical protein ACFZBP_36545 [Streptomyces sp. NPDC008086]|uniref:hypothetical protein n=1 Tax=Streptomyces sp. NPDC008086 TaxID=3364807 RepID=UPI0036E08F98